MSERMVPANRWSESSIPPVELLPYWKEEIIGYYPPDALYERAVPDGLADKKFGGLLQTLSQYLSLPVLEDKWGLYGTQEEERRLLFRRDLPTEEAYKAFERNKLRISPITAALLAVREIAEYLYDPQHTDILKERQKFFDLIRPMWKPGKTTQQQKEAVVKEFTVFVAKVFDAALKDYEKAPDW